MKTKLFLVFLILAMTKIAFAGCCKSWEWTYKEEGGLIDKPLFKKGEVIYKKQIIFVSRPSTDNPYEIIYTYMGIKRGQIIIKKEVLGPSASDPTFSEPYHMGYQNTVVSLVPNDQHLAWINIDGIDFGMCGGGPCGDNGHCDYGCITDGEDLLIEVINKKEIKVTSLGKTIVQ